MHKNFKEEIEAMKAQIAALENNLTYQVETPEQAKTIVFTKEELVKFATQLMERTVETCRVAIKEVEFDPDYCCELSLCINNQIEIEIDNSAIQEVISNEIYNEIGRAHV